MTLLADVVGASRAVAETSSRSAKVAILADLLRELEPDEIPIVTAFLSGVPRQGRIGVGYASVYRRDSATAGGEPLSVGDVDRALDEIRAATGTGSAATRGHLLDGVFARATEAKRTSSNAC